MFRYKTKYKSIWSNLKNYVQNSQLGEKLLMGVLVAAKIVTMTPQEMASDEMRKSRQVRVWYMLVVVVVYLPGNK